MEFWAFWEILEKGLDRRKMEGWLVEKFWEKEYGRRKEF